VGVCFATRLPDVQKELIRELEVAKKEIPRVGGQEGAEILQGSLDWMEYIKLVTLIKLKITNLP